jgi:hypothetical protein
MEWVYAFAAAASALSAVLAWIAKIYWSKEFAVAKDEIIKAKDAQMALVERENLSLKELTPMKIREYFISVRTQLEENIDSLKSSLSEATKEIEIRDNQIAELIQHGGAQAEEIKRLETEKTKFEAAVNKIKTVTESSIMNKDSIWKNWVTLEANMATVKASELNKLYSISHDDMKGQFKSSIKILNSNINNSYVEVQPADKSVSSNKNNP